MIKNISEIEQLLKLKEGAIREAIDSEDEISIEIPGLTVRSQEEESLFKENLEKERKKSYNDGLETGEKRAINSLAGQFEVDLENKAKTADNFTAVFKEKIESGLNQSENEQIQSLKSDNDQLRENLLTVQNEFNTYKSEKEHEDQHRAINGEVMSALPDNGTTVSKTDLAVLFHSNHTGGLNDSNQVIWSNNTGVIKDSHTLAPKTTQEVVKEFIKPYLKSPEGGSGEGDVTRNGAMSYDDFESEMKEQNIKPGSQGFQAELNKRVSEGTVKI